LEVVTKAIYHLIFTLHGLCSQLQYGLFQGCGAVVKMTQLPLRSSSFHEYGSGALAFHECCSGYGALFHHGSGFSSGFWSFLHIYILIFLVCLNLNGKWI